MRHIRHGCWAFGPQQVHLRVSSPPFETIAVLVCIVLQLHLDVRAFDANRFVELGPPQNTFHCRRYLGPTDRIPSEVLSSANHDVDFESLRDRREIADEVKSPKSTQVVHQIYHNQHRRLLQPRKTGTSRTYLKPSMQQKTSRIWSACNSEA